jgi:hypothetical protein
MMDAMSENEPARQSPSTLQHLLFLGGCWSLLPFVYWEDYGWPGAAPSVPSGGNWITLDFTGLMTTAYAWFAAIYTALTTWAFMRARQRARKMSWAQYIAYAPMSVLRLINLWFAHVALD